MKSIIFALILVMVMIMPAMAYSGNGIGMAGTGTLYDPFVITNASQWYQANSDDPNCVGGWIGGYAHYRLGNDIIFTGVEDPAINCFDGFLDGDTRSLINFRNTTIVPTPGATVYQISYGMISHMAQSIDDLILRNCSMEYSGVVGDNNATSASYYFGTLVGKQTGGHILNVYVDENTHLNLTGVVGNGDHWIGSVSGYAYSIDNVVSRGNIYLANPARGVAGAQTNLGGISGGVITGAVSVFNMLSAGTMSYTVNGSETDYGYNIIGSTVYDAPLGSSWYYDSTTLAGIQAKANTWGVSTVGMTNQANFPNMTFGAGNMAMSNISSIFNGYPIPYVFLAYPVPTPTPTPTPVPTFTGTPTPTATPTPTMPASPTIIRWTNLAGTSISSAYYGDSVRWSFDSVVPGINPPWFQCDYFYFNIWGKDKVTGQWIYLASPGWFGNVNGSITLLEFPQGYAEPFSGEAWSGWNQMVLTTIYNQYKVEMIGYNSTGLGGSYLYGTATLNAAKNPLLFTNIGDWAFAFGGDGLRYLLAVIIIVVLGCIPFLITRNFNLYVEIIMIIFGIGISTAIGLLDLWVVAALIIGVVALYALKRGGQ